MSKSQKHPNEVPSYRYWAFISYSSKDKKWASWLHRAIETYGIPAHLVNHQTPAGQPAPKRFHPLFHDRSELPASADLGARIEEALRQSHYLIVVCSPHAAQSKWVNKEIETFRHLGRTNCILAIIVDGDPNAGGDRECFPPALCAHEPIAADARPTIDGKSNAKLKLLAGMLGVGFDALKQRDSQRRIRRLQIILAVTLALITGFVALAWFANTQKIKAEKTLYELQKEDYRNVIRLADRKIGEGMLAEAEQMLLGTLPGLRGWEWGWLLNLCHLDLIHLRMPMEEDVKVRLSPSGKEILVETQYALSQWDIASGKQLSASNETLGVPESVSPYFEKKFLIKTRGSSIVWDSVTGEKTLSVDPRYWPAFASFGHEENRLFSRCGDGSLLTWDLSTGKVLDEIPAKRDYPDILAFSRDGRRAVIGAIPIQSLRIVDLADGHVVQLQDSAIPNGLPAPSCFSWDGKRVGVWNGSVVRFWDAETGVRLRDQKVGVEKVTALALSNDERYLAFGVGGQLAASPSGIPMNAFADPSLQGPFGGNLHILDMQQDTVSRIFHGHASTVQSASFSPDGQRIAIGSQDTIRLWDMQTGRKEFELDTPGSKSEFDKTPFVGFSSDGKRLISITEGGLTVWDVSPHLRQDLAVLARTAAAFQTASLTKELAVQRRTSDWQQVVLTDLRTGREIRNLEGQCGYTFLSGRFSHDGTLVACGGADAHVWDVSTGRRLFYLSESKARILAITISYDNRTLITGHDDGGVNLWDIVTGSRKSHFLSTGQHKKVYKISCSQSDRFRRIGHDFGNRLG